ncbi:MAG: metal ABC transporter ATP-binding protein [Lachnospiraceae bacterium]|nr:metal ABC transporter ATP-binding protein [Lachnospiraceae bacterium]
MAGEVIKPAELICRGLALGYENQILISDLNFTVNAGDYLCIVGENGAGKSTLMRTILRLQKPLAGSVVYGDGLTANQLGYLPQQTVVQRDFPASVREVVLSGCQSKLGRHMFYPPRLKKLAQMNMERMGIDQLANRCYRELSGGQQQRVLLARALCATERMLFLDEPVAGLDPKVTIEMYRLISQLNREGTTILMITHDVHMAAKYATHILHLGQEVFFGTTDEYRASKIGRRYLDDEQETAADDETEVTV